jgi:hypothetical protein
MFSNLSNPFDLALVIVGTIFLLKKVAEMDRYLGLRVVVLTSILSCGVIYSVCSVSDYLFPPASCVIDFTSSEDQF